MAALHQHRERGAPRPFPAHGCFLILCSRFLFYFSLSTFTLPSPTHRILGIEFFGGTSREAVDVITRRGGLLVAPAAPSMIALCRDPDYRRALLSAELAIADSGFMVLLWKLCTPARASRASLV